jgi:hypothetical protein
MDEVQKPISFIQQPPSEPTSGEGQVFGIVGQDIVVTADNDVPLSGVTWCNWTLVSAESFLFSYWNA